MPTKNPNVRATMEAIGAFLRERGHKRASYWLGEDAAEAIGSIARLHCREEAAEALSLGHSVTLDVNYNGRLSVTQPSYTVRLDARNYIEEVKS